MNVNKTSCPQHLIELPKEIIQEILIYLPDQELMQIIPLVCKTLHGIATSVELEIEWKKRIIQQISASDRERLYLQERSWRKAYLAFKKTSPCIWAEILLKQKDFKNAEKFCQKGLTLNPNNVAVIQTYVSILSSYAKFIEARKQIEKAVKLDPENISVLKQYGTILYILGYNIEGKEQHVKASKIEKRMSLS